MGFDMRWHNATSATDTESYFRLNIGGMRRTVEVMAALDMVFITDSPTGDDWAAVNALYDEAAEGGDRYEAAACEMVSRLAAEERPGIPVHKLFSTNDGWHVQPIEIRGALHQYRQAFEVDRERVADVTGGCSWWDEWIDYLERAAANGEGFRVR